jgi:hypothetical protein
MALSLKRWHKMLNFISQPFQLNAAKKKEIVRTTQQQCNDHSECNEYAIVVVIMVFSSV